MNLKFLNKAGAAVMAAAMMMNGSAVLNTGTTFAAGTKYEFEDATMTGTIMVEDNADASGGKSIKMEDSGTITLKFDVEKAGVYNLVIYCGGIGGAKQQNLTINGVSQGALGVPESEGFEAVKVSSVKLQAGENTLVIEKSWGWSNFDYMTVEDASSTPIIATQTTPVDAKATAETKNLMSYLASVYGEHIISGQQEIYMYGHGGNFEYEFDYLKDLTGKLPAVRGFDFLNCANILYGSEDGTTDRIIDWVNNKNGIATASWHVVVPKKMEGYKVGDSVSYENSTYGVKDNNGNPATDFVTSNVLKEGTIEREYYLAALESLAGQIQKLQDAGVPIILRPLHEAEGGGGENGSWFWWGKEGSAVYKELWKLTYKTLTEDYGLHNIIWEWNSYNFTTSADWYPGDEYVDIIGYDKYNCTVYLAENNWAPSLVHDDSAISATFYGIAEKYNNAKMVAMAENDCFSTVENLTSERAGWLYFCTWYDGGADNINFLSNPTFNTEQDTIDMYQSEYCITLDELPADLYSKGGEQRPTTQTTTTASGSGNSTTTTTTATTEADPSKDYGKVVYDSKKNSYSVTLPKAEKEFYIDVELPKGIEYANGGLGVSVELDGEYYWANIKWETNASGSVKVNALDNFFNCSLGTETIEDEELIEKIKAELGKATAYECQVWYAQENGKAASTDGIKINSVYIKNGDSTTTKPTGSADGVKGDANQDGKLTIADAVLIMQSLANPNEYKLSEEASDLADVYDYGSGLTTRDALVVQMVDIEMISAEDLPVGADFEF